MSLLAILFFVISNILEVFAWFEIETQINSKVSINLAMLFVSYNEELAQETKLSCVRRPKPRGATLMVHVTAFLQTSLYFKTPFFHKLLPH